MWGKDSQQGAAGSGWWHERKVNCAAVCHSLEDITVFRACTLLRNKAASVSVREELRRQADNVSTASDEVRPLKTVRRSLAPINSIIVVDPLPLPICEVTGAHFYLAT